MSVHVAEKKSSTLKGTNGLIATENEAEGDWQNGQNLVVVAQEGQGKELVLSESQTINVTLDTYCSYILCRHLVDFSRRELISLSLYWNENVNAMIADVQMSVHERPAMVTEGKLR